MSVKVEGLTVTGECACGAKLVSPHAWKALSKEQRALLLHGRFVPAGNRGVCVNCVHRARQQGGLIGGPEDPRHGTVNGYTNLGCRCQHCRDAWTAEFKRQRIRRGERIAADPSLATHGLASTYENWRCRCRPCTDAHTRATREQRARRSR